MHACVPQSPVGHAAIAFRPAWMDEACMCTAAALVSRLLLSFAGWPFDRPSEILRPKSHVWCSHTTARASLGTSTAGVVPRGPGATAGVLRCPPGCTVVARATKNTPNRLVIAVFAGFLKRAARGGVPGAPGRRPPPAQTPTRYAAGAPLPCAGAVER